MAIWPLDTVRGNRSGLRPYRGVCRVDRPDCGSITPWQRNRSRRDEQIDQGAGDEQAMGVLCEPR